MTTELLKQLKEHRADGLFNPKSEPRNLSIIKQQLWEAIGK